MSSQNIVHITASCRLRPTPRWVNLVELINSRFDSSRCPTCFLQSFNFCSGCSWCACRQGCLNEITNHLGLIFVCLQLLDKVLVALGLLGFFVLLVVICFGLPGLSQTRICPDDGLGGFTQGGARLFVTVRNVDQNCGSAE